MGGLITLNLLRAATPGVTKAIIIDSPIGLTATGDSPEDDDLLEHRPRLYPTDEEILSRFRAVPAQSSLLFVFDHIARHSIREIDGGWTWRFDGALFANRTGFGIRTVLASWDASE
ncbi:MAG: alpha/beta hydrolase [Subtercola sp.]|nr:alpha/beta hydrolase [Subtercola sp.]